MRDLLTQVIARASGAAPIADLAGWRERHEQASRCATATVDRAILAGASMDRIGYAFASGYRSAIEALTPGLIGPGVLAATEAGGAHPRAIQTTLTRDAEGQRVDGAKEWCTLGPHAEELLVVAKSGDGADGRPSLRLVRVSPAAPGVALEPLPPLPFVPEIPHARLTLTAVRVRDGDVLPGDGYALYLKPFRTIEDVHVHAAIVAHVAGLAIRGRAPLEVLDSSLALLSALRELARQDHSAAETHLALAGVIEQGKALVARAAPDAAITDEEAQRFRRDLPLLGVAGKARAARLQSARERLGLATSARVG